MGRQGAFYYIPAGTRSCLGSDDFPATGGIISVGANKGYQVDDYVSLTYPVGATVTGAITAGQYYVKSYDEVTGSLTLSSQKGGTIATATAKPSNFGAGHAEIAWADHAPVAQTQSWTFNMTRTEVDVSTIGRGTSKYTPFKKYQTNDADATGNAVVFFTDDDLDIANRMVEDAYRNEQYGASVRLVIDQVLDAGEFDDGKSRFVEMPVVLTSANLGANTDGGQTVDISFRPSGDVVIDLKRT